MLKLLFLRILWIFKRSKISEFKDIHKGKTCHLLANGPSLNKLDFNSVANEYVFTLNKIHLHPDYNLLKRRYHVAVNKHVLAQSANEMSANALETFVPLRFSNFFKRNVVVLNDFFPFERFTKDLKFSVSQGGTVTFVALQIIYYMGFKKVYIHGLDHYFHQSGSPNDLQKMEGDDVNHFSKDYFKGNHWQLADIYNSELSYLIADYTFRNDGRSILNVSPESRCEIFEKSKWTNH